MDACCAASATAVALSDRTFAATAAFTGMAMFALISDIAARSGSSSPARPSSSSRVSFRYSLIHSSWSIAGRGPTLAGRRCPLVLLRDVRGLLGVRDRGRVVAEDVQRCRDIHGSGDIRVDQRHRGPFGKRLARDLVEFLAGQLPVLLVTHVDPLSASRAR